MKKERNKAMKNKQKKYVKLRKKTDRPTELFHFIVKNFNMWQFITYYYSCL